MIMRLSRPCWRAISTLKIANDSRQEIHVRIRNAILTERLGYTALWRISSFFGSGRHAEKASAKQ